MSEKVGFHVESKLELSLEEEEMGVIESMEWGQICQMKGPAHAKSQRHKCF